MYNSTEMAGTDCTDRQHSNNSLLSADVGSLQTATQCAIVWGKNSIVGTVFFVSAGDESVFAKNL